MWVKRSSGTAGSERYSIAFYDNANRNLFAESNQGDRTYVVGGNVTRIVIQRANNLAAAATTYWRRS